MCALNFFFAQKLLRKVKNWSRLLKPQKLLQKLKGAQTLPNTIGTGLLGIDHFTFVSLVPLPLSEREAGVDLVLIQNSFLLL